MFAMKLEQGQEPNKYFSGFKTVHKFVAKFGSQTHPQGFGEPCGPNDTIPISGASLAYLLSLAEPSQKRRATDKKQRKGCELANFISTTSVGQRQLAKNAPAPDVPMAEVLSLDIGCHDDDSNSDF